MTEPKMLLEAAEVPDRLARTLADDAEAYAQAARRIREFAPRLLVTIARGSSDHAADYAARLIAQTTGIMPLSLPPSLVTVENAPLDWRGALVLAISQSGRSPDLIAPLRAARAGGALTVALVNAPDSPLAEAADIALPVGAGEETAIAATKSFVLSLAQGARLAALLGADKPLLDALAAAPAPLARALRADWSGALPILRENDAFYVTGRGLGFALAREAALKFKEVCGQRAEASSGAEIMHGPKAVIRPGEPVLAIAPDDRSRVSMETAMDELAALGAQILCAGPRHGGARELAAPRLGDPRLDPLSLASAFYPFCAALAGARGLSPDDPPNLRKVTETL